MWLLRSKLYVKLEGLCFVFAGQLHLSTFVVEAGLEKLGKA